MSDKRYLGNIITPTPTEPTTSVASGVWSLSEAFTYKKAGLWPIVLGGPGFAFQISRTSTNLGNIGYFYIATTGNVTDFSDIQTSQVLAASCSSATRGLIAGGVSSDINVIEYVTIPTAGSWADFGDLTLSISFCAGLSNSTRGVWAGGRSPDTNVIQYVTIASTGNATDFGDLQVATERLAGNICNGTRGLFAGGDNSPTINTINYITLASAGNASDFGDLIYDMANFVGMANSTRGVWAGGNSDTSGVTNGIQYVTIASTGNSVDFGDAQTSGSKNAVSAADSTRGVYGEGTTVNTLSYITFASTGNAVDFGDLVLFSGASSYASCAVDNSHGGLS